MGREYERVTSEWGFTWGFKGTPFIGAEIVMGLARPHDPAGSRPRNIWHVVTGKMHCNPDDSSSVIIEKLQGSRFPNHAVFVDKIFRYATAPGFFIDLWTPDDVDNTMVVRGTPVGVWYP